MAVYAALHTATTNANEIYAAWSASPQLMDSRNRFASSQAKAETAAADDPSQLDLLDQNNQ